MHDLAENHDFALDEKMRRALIERIERGIYFFPMATKRSISAAHSEADVDATLESVGQVLSEFALPKSGH
ncbi:MAG: hypothetical protein L0387_27455 [Acidobacteria bacterium]|nr:hypothetical protein [Acidobacteriota bacterium]MCI0625338.1 hypothetical protein [Acidobacteriota bacterium]MCI0721043.1 hypothetical protein [Acidobacteriota bacterium]